MTTQTTPQMTEQQHHLLMLGIESEVRSAERTIEDFKTRFAKEPMLWRMQGWGKNECLVLSA